MKEKKKKKRIQTRTDAPDTSNFFLARHFSDQSGRRARVAAVEDYVREKNLSEVEASKYRRKVRKERLASHTHSLMCLEYRC
jgi:hypothetical protein